MQCSATSDTRASDAARFDSDVDTPETRAADLVDRATDPDTGDVDTACLAGWVADAAGQDADTASAAHAAIETELLARSPADASRFNADVVSAFGGAVFGAGQGFVVGGGLLLEQNPILSKVWEPTRSAWTGKGGFTSGLQQLLEANGIEIGRTVHAPPAGSLGKGSGVSAAVANNTNGALARDAIADRFRAQGLATQIEQPRHGGARVVDVVTDVPATDPRQARRVEVESKVGRVSLDSDIRRQVDFDARSLAQNRAIRQTGDVLEKLGKVARPVGLVLDAVAVGEAFRADGNRVGEKTGRTASGVAGGALGGWGGAAAGAAIGTAIFPGVGTVVGGVVGGIAGALAGDAAGKGLFDTVKNWF